MGIVLEAKMNSGYEQVAKMGSGAGGYSKGVSFCVCVLDQPKGEDVLMTDYRICTYRFGQITLLNPC